METLRRRKTEGATKVREPPTEKETSLTPKNAAGKPQPSLSIHASRRTAYFFIPSLVSIIVLAYGAYLNHSLLYTHDECDMTWSQRAYVAIPLPRDDSSTPQLYHLYKFIDRRDPRNQGLLQDLSSTQDTSTMSWCYAHPNDASTTTAVLYVPGHGGSYRQARSLGAHGVQLTRRQLSMQQTRHVQHSLLSQKWSGNTTNLEDFVYDVFAVDFNEEPTGLHGAFVQRQAEFLTRATHHLIKACQFHQIVLVTHSMGGYAAELARILDPSVQPFLRNQITLGTPYAHPILSWESTMYEIHHRIQQDASRNNNLAVVSISGGLRDEMIPPRACDDSPHPASLSIVATDIMTTATDQDSVKLTPTLGMDHKAIVWCHNVLDKVRIIIHELAVHDHLPAMERVKRTQERLELLSVDYEESIRQQEGMLRTLFGWKAFAMETAFIYNITWLVSLYSYISLIHCVVSVQTIRSTSLGNVVSKLVVPLMAALQCWTDASSNRLSLGSACMLSFAASLFFHLIYYAVDSVVAGRWAHMARRRIIQVTALALILSLSLVATAWFLACLLSLLPFPLIQLKVWIALAVILFMYTVTIIQVGTTTRRRSDAATGSRSVLQSMLNLSTRPEYYMQAMHHRRVVIAAWLLPISHFLLAGDVALILKHGEAQPLVYLLVVAPIILWNLTCIVLDSLARSFGKGRISMLAYGLRIVTVVQSGTSLFRLSPLNGYAFGTIESLMAMIRLEMLEMLIVWLMGRVAPG